MSEERLKEILDLCLRAGNIMLDNGAETSRIEETVSRFARAHGADVVHSFVIPTGIFMSVEADGKEKTGMVRTHASSAINLYKVHEVNDLSRRFERGQVAYAEASERLTQIERHKLYYRLRYQHLASALASGAFSYLFGGGWAEFMVGAVCGWLSNTVAEGVGKMVPSFLRIFLAVVIGVAVAVLGVKLSIASNLQATTIGAVIPLVPGVPVTNAVRDLMAGELMAGISRACEAGLTAFAIAVAVALVLAFLAPGVFLR
ncbi:MAG: threonine/serine exporter family protein [Tumebacillaceae bacterium]